MVYFYISPLLDFSSIRVHSECTPYICLSGNESKMNRHALTVSLVDHVTVAVYASDKQPHVMHGSLSISNPASSPSKNSICGAVTFFMWFILLSWVLWPWLPPPPHPLAISFYNPSLCFCNEKQHSSRGMTSSVSTGAGTDDATLPEDWIAHAGCCERNPLVVTPTLLLICWPNTLWYPGKRTWWILLFIAADTSGPSNIISTFIINSA